MIFHVHQVEKFFWRTLLNFMSTKWKLLAGELYYISCPRSGKVWQKRSTIFRVHRVENFSWGTISCPQSGKVRLEWCKILYVSEVEKYIWRTVRYFNIHQLKNLNWKVLPYFITTKWKCSLENSTKFHVYKVEQFNWSTVQYFLSTKWKS